MIVMPFTSITVDPNAHVVIRCQMANNYSSRSLRALSNVHPDLVLVFQHVLPYWDHVVLEGHRSRERHGTLLRSGASQVPYWKSKHSASPSKALDVAPYPIDWQDTSRFYHFAGFVLGVATGLGVELRWGGDWDGDRNTREETFRDLVHFELA